MWVEFDNNVKTSRVNSLNKAFECDLKCIVEDDMDFVPDSIKAVLEKTRKEF